ncbi:uncharacterized protein LOC122813711 isoform X1 [Protopterus annectens]|uniref:uncharacterized protein LOC122813711 isoform X1 n=1 Tax=Protopterus annectens TaxID=7888 RepID=UPI001CFAF1CF|nr:uncharacterized protein LOC122813711 isoform X1 [Protopterus annectens]
MIPNSRGIDSVQNYLKKNTSMDSSLIELLALFLEIILENVFVFGDELYIQNDGIAMGTSCANSYANIVMAEWEKETLFPSVEFGQYVAFYKRFVDNLFLIWRGDEAQLHHFESFMNSTTSYLKFTMSHSRDCISFLDIDIIKLVNGLVNTSVHRKTCYKNTLLHRTSMHPLHVFENVIKGQTMRASRLNPTEDGFKKEIVKLRDRLVKRSYQEDEIDRTLTDTYSLRETRVCPYFSSRYSSGSSEVKRQESRSRSTTLNIPIYYTSDVSNIKQIIEKHWGILSVDDDINNVVGVKPRYTYKNKMNLKNLLCHKNGGRYMSSSFNTTPCGSCHQCVLINTGNNFKQPITGQVFFFFTGTNCRSENVIYLATCMACPAFYVGKTNRQLRERIREHVYKMRVGDVTNALAKHQKMAGFSHTFTFFVLQHIHTTLRGGNLEAYTLEMELRWIIRCRADSKPGLNDKVSLQAILKRRKIDTTLRRTQANI